MASLVVVAAHCGSLAGRRRDEITRSDIARVLQSIVTLSLSLNFCSYFYFYLTAAVCSGGGSGSSGQPSGRFLFAACCYSSASRLAAPATKLNCISAQRKSHISARCSERANQFRR